MTADANVKDSSRDKSEAKERDQRKDEDSSSSSRHKYDDRDRSSRKDSDSKDRSVTGDKERERRRHVKNRLLVYFYLLRCLLFIF